VPTQAEALIASINKKWGDGTIIRGTALKDVVVTYLTTGSLVFDVMLGGGWVRNQWNEVIGEESSGKTSAVLKAVAKNQLLDPHFEVLWIAAEDLDADWVQQLGCDLDRMYIVATNVMEEAYQIVIDFIEKQAVDMVVIDSLPALVPSDEDEKEVEEFTVALGAKLTNKFFRKVTSAGKRAITNDERPCTGVLVNQYRLKIGVMRGDPRTTPGGMGKNYAYWTRTELARSEWIEHEKEKVGIRIKGRTIKNKSAPTNRDGLVDFYFTAAKGFAAGDYDVARDVANIAIAYNVVERHGSSYEYQDRKWRGRDPLFEDIVEDEKLRKMIERDVMAAIGAPMPEPEPEPPKKSGIKRRKQ
jgi:recombination protein RecA